MGYHTASYGAILYERIGAVRFSMNGELYTTIDLGTMLQDMEKTHEGDTFGIFRATSGFLLFMFGRNVP
jgi:hypothetical protein